MITTEEVLNNDKLAVRERLTTAGYISAANLYRMSEGKLLENYGICKEALPSPDNLRDIIDIIPLNCVCLEFENGKKSYWYMVDELTGFEVIQSDSGFDGRMLEGYTIHADPIEETIADTAEDVVEAMKDADVKEDLQEFSIIGSRVMILLVTILGAGLLIGALCFIF